MFTIFQSPRPLRPCHSPTISASVRISCGRSAGPYSDEPSPCALRASAEMTLDFAARKARALAIDRPVPYSRRGGVLRRCVFFRGQARLAVAIPPGYATACWPPLESPASVLLLGSAIWPGSGWALFRSSTSRSRSRSWPRRSSAGKPWKRSRAALSARLSARPGLPARRGRGQVRRHRGGQRDDRGEPSRRAPLAFRALSAFARVVVELVDMVAGDTVGIIVALPDPGLVCRPRPAWTPWKIAEGSPSRLPPGGVKYE